MFTLRLFLLHIILFDISKKTYAEKLFDEIMRFLFGIIRFFYFTLMCLFTDFGLKIIFFGSLILSNSMFYLLIVPSAVPT